jgi:hypothetical protein
LTLSAAPRLPNRSASSLDASASISTKDSLPTSLDQQVRLDVAERGRVACGRYQAIPKTHLEAP